MYKIHDFHMQKPDLGYAPEAPQGVSGGTEPPGMVYFFFAHLRYGCLALVQVVEIIKQHQRGALRPHLPPRLRRMTFSPHTKIGHVNIKSHIWIIQVREIVKQLEKNNIFVLLSTFLKIIVLEFIILPLTVLKVGVWNFDFLLTTPCANKSHTLSSPWSKSLKKFV